MPAGESDYRNDLNSFAPVENVDRRHNVSISARTRRINRVSTRMKQPL